MNSSRLQKLEAAFKSRILILDGAMGTMIQTYKLDEAAYRGQRFARHAHDLKGNNDLLVLTQPQIIQEIHEQYLAAGADVIETNTFGATTVAHNQLLADHIPNAKIKFYDDVGHFCQLEKPMDFNADLRGFLQQFS